MCDYVIRIWHDSIDMLMYAMRDLCMYVIVLIDFYLCMLECEIVNYA